MLLTRFLKHNLKPVLIIFIIVLLIISIFTTTLFFQIWDFENARFLDDGKFGNIKSEMDHGILMADSDIIFIEGTAYPHPDKLFDIEEIWIYNTNETNPDTDGDGMEDGWEVYNSKIDPITGLPTLDPLIFDAFENPDMDGWDENNNGILDGQEHLTNLEEYCNGSFNWGPFKGLNLNPQRHYENWKKLIATDKEKANMEYDKYIKDTNYIRNHGGFHLVDYPYSQVIIEKFADYPKAPTREYNEYDQQKAQPLTTNPSNSDTDSDGMADGFECFFREKCEYIKRTYFPNFNYTFNPLDLSDARLNFDLKKTDRCVRGEIGLEYEFKPDNLTNVHEFEFGADPTMWDTDDDSYYDPYTGKIVWLPDHYELTGFIYYYPKNIGWRECLCEYLEYTDPNNPDTDGDDMEDGYEEFYGLNPCNASDKFSDLDGDGLPNFLEYAYPIGTDVWFRTFPNDPDTDDDGLSDGWEVFNTELLNKTLNATPQMDILDGIADGIAYDFSYNPMIPDADLNVNETRYGNSIDVKKYKK